MIRSLFSLLVTLSLLAGLTACTPRPDVADYVAEDFLSQLREKTDPASLTDQPDQAKQEISHTWEKLQAESLDAELKNVNTKDNIATANFRLGWNLPGDRRFEYESQMKLTKSGTQWIVRWQPTLLHPELGANQHLELRTVPAETASVVGSDGAVLTKPGTRWRVLVRARETEDLRGVIQAVAAELDQLRADNDSIPVVDVDAATRQARNFDGDFSLLTVDDATGKRLKGRLGKMVDIRFNEEAALVRPDPNFAPDILSRVNAIVADELEGTNGWTVIAATPEGNEVRRLVEHDPKQAPAVQVSLSRRVQDAAQKAVDTRKEAKAMMVVIRPSTGEVLAVAQTKEADKDGDVALQGQYPPGSTFKIITAYAGLQRQGLRPESIVGCPGTQNIGGRIVTNYNGSGVGDTPLETAFARSCNTTFADISSKLQPGELKDVGNLFGLGVDFEIPGLDTFTGSVPHGDILLDRTEAGYGQGLDLVSPFGMALVSATAAAGRMPTPVLIKSDKHKTATKLDDGKKLDPIKTKQLQQMMRSVVTGGTAAGINHGNIHAKTGEAEINDGSHAWFTGYRDDLAFATLIVRGGGSEHSVAMTSEFFRHLDDR